MLKNKQHIQIYTYHVYISCDNTIRSSLRRMGKLNAKVYLKNVSKYLKIKICYSKC